MCPSHACGCAGINRTNECKIASDWRTTSFHWLETYYSIAEPRTKCCDQVFWSSALQPPLRLAFRGVVKRTSRIFILMLCVDDLGLLEVHCLPISGILIRMSSLFLLSRTWAFQTRGRGRAVNHDFNGRILVLNRRGNTVLPLCCNRLRKERE